MRLPGSILIPVVLDFLCAESASARESTPPLPKLGGYIQVRESWAEQHSGSGPACSMARGRTWS